MIVPAQIAAESSRPRSPRKQSMAPEPEHRPTKQGIVIRRDLRMRRGKEIAQGAHAATALLAELDLQAMTMNGAVDHVTLSAAEPSWLQSSVGKVPVTVKSDQQG